MSGYFLNMSDTIRERLVMSCEFSRIGRGIFHIHPEGGDVVAIEVEEGDLIRVPRGTKHCLCSMESIRKYPEIAL